MSGKLNKNATTTALLLAVITTLPSAAEGFAPHQFHASAIAETRQGEARQRLDLQLSMTSDRNCEVAPMFDNAFKFFTSIATAATLSAALFIAAPSAMAENELSTKYGGRGFDTSLVDQTCLVNKCSLQAKACLADDPSCRKGLTCTAKCLGDNACITGCMARYGDSNLDDLLKCTIEDNKCIKVAILDGGSDKYGEEPRPPAPTVKNFHMNSMQGTWYKVVGFNPNYDCYACQRNAFTLPDNGGNVFSAGSNDRLEVDVEFSMPRMMPDGTPPPPTKAKENIFQDEDGLMYGSKSIGFNDYQTHEVMIFDSKRDVKSRMVDLVLGKESSSRVSYSRTAHSEGEMFGLKFWENWYIIGENDPDQPEFKFVFYNGKTRQNTYEGAFVYSRTKDLGPEAMKKVYKIASDAGMNPDQFCKIRNGCFNSDAPETGLGSPTNPFRGILASTKISQLLGVEPVAAENVLKSTHTATAKLGKDDSALSSKRAWWYEIGDYLENPRRHFEAMDSLRITMDWPEFVKE